MFVDIPCWKMLLIVLTVFHDRKFMLTVSMLILFMVMEYSLMTYTYRQNIGKRLKSFYGNPA